MQTQDTPASTQGELALHKNKLIAASGITALLCFALLVYPASQVEAKKIPLDLSIDESSFIEQHSGLGSPNEQDVFALVAPESQLDEDLVTSAATAESELLVTNASTPDEAADTTPKEQHSTYVVQSGDTLSKVFANMGLGNSTLVAILAQETEAKRFTDLKIGQKLHFTLLDDGSLQELSTELSKISSIHLTRSEASGDYKFSKHTKETSSKQKMVSGTITDTLPGAAKKAGLPYKLTLDLANIFGFDIDFARDLREGDSFKVVFEENLIDDQVVSSGKILAASFTNRNKTYTAIRYTDKNGNTSYYNLDGGNTQKAFIRTPVDFARISSRFNPNRRHPVLNTIRAHKGVDYAAPTGTPIKATGDGKISFIGNRNGYGKTIIIRHGKTYRTLYAHMNGFAKGIKNGSTVKQGQIIGYVGMTGLASGPHLHYEFHVNGTHVNPLSHTLPAADPLNKNELARFKQQTAAHVAMLQDETTVALSSD